MALETVKAELKTATELQTEINPEKVRELSQVRAQISVLKKAEEKLKDLVTGFFKNKAKAEDLNNVAYKPSFVTEIDGERYQTQWGTQDRSQVSPEKTEAYLRSRGMWDELSKPVRVIDEEKLAAALANGTITKAEFEQNCMDIKVIRLVNVKKLS